jgi:hypothetical protein
MSVHILRDFNPAASGYAASGVPPFFMPYLYGLAIYLNKILGYSVVGNTGFDINNTNSQTFANSVTVAIAGASGGQSLPQSTINVNTTAGFTTSGIIYVATSAGIQIVKYSGTTATTFTNCTGGTGTMTAGVTTTIAVASNGVALPAATINVASTAGFASSGTIYVITTAGPQLVTYTGIGATTFTGCTGGTGTMNTGNSVSFAGGSVTYAQNKIVSAVITGTPVITTNFPHGMNTGDYAQITGAGTINISFGPYQTEVVSPTQLRLLAHAALGSYTANSQTLVPPGMLIASGTGASINFAGAPSVYAVSVPATTRTVVSGTAPTTGDNGRILVLKSNTYPTKNSGIYKITSVNTATNSYTIDYRSTDTPPPETGTLNWSLYEIETQASNYILFPDYNRTVETVSAATNTIPIQITYNINVVGYFKTGQKVNITGVGGNTAANGTWTITVNGANTFLLDNSVGNGTYTSGGSLFRVGYTGGNSLSFNSKILLQSPHPSGWQVRICVEAYNRPGAQLGHTNISVGYGGSSQGDFPVGGITTHIEQFLDITVNGGAYSNAAPGSSSNSYAPRVNIVGDDSGQSIFMYTRPVSAGTNGLLIFGIPDNEPTPLSPNANRIFVYGSALTGDYGGIQMRWGSSQNVGFTFRDVNPEMCAIAGWANADGVSGTSPVYSANAGDCPFTGTTELLPWELWGGVATDISLALPYPAAGQTVYDINQRFMGTLKFLRQGRTNFGTFTLSTDNTASLTVTGASTGSPIQITTSAANALVTGQTVVISGVTGNTAANGTFVITVVDSTHFNLNGTTGVTPYASGGTVNGTAQWLHLQNGIYLQWNGAGGLSP